MGALAVQCKTDGDHAATCASGKCEVVGSTEVCTQCKAGGVPVDGLCRPSTSPQATAAGCTGDASAGVCEACSGGFFLFRGGCYSSSAAPGSGVCREARDGACVRHAEEMSKQRVFFCPSATSRRAPGVLRGLHREPHERAQREDGARDRDLQQGGPRPQARDGHERPRADREQSIDEYLRDSEILSRHCESIARDGAEPIATRRTSYDEVVRTMGSVLDGLQNNMKKISPFVRPEDDQEERLVF